MASRLLRRSGVAVALIAELLEWEPTHIFQVGIGTHHNETEVFQEAWPKAKLEGWEPHPEISASINYPGVLHNYALSDKNGFEDFYCHSKHLEGASIFRDDGCDKGFSCQSKRMDSIISIPPKRWHILYWLDCEGSELKVLAGSLAFLSGVEVVNIEVTGKPPREGDWPTPVEINRFLLGRGFLLQYIHTHRCTSGQNDMVYVKPKLFRPEYCSCPLQIEDFEKRFGDGISTE